MWREKEPTDKQKKAIYNMRYALGYKGQSLHKMPETRGAASDEIKKLRQTILNNLSLGGTIDPSRSVYANDGDWGLGQGDHGAI